jgi:hypothetical protein
MMTPITNSQQRTTSILLNRAIMNSNTETDTMQNPKTNLYSNTLRGLAVSAVALTLAGMLSGCGLASSTAGSGSGSGSSLVQITGNVHGGQQPVSGSTIQLYTVGTTGLKTASATMIASTVTTDASGNFNVTGKYNCAALPATQVYIVATGGNPIPGTPNNSLALMAALGSCSSLGASTFIQINELTTVAAAYALAPFAQDYTHIGATGFNPTGLVNAFANAGNLVNFSTGQTPGTSLPAGAIEPVTELNTLADILAACVNSNGSTTPCNTLYGATGTANTIDAALAIAKNPGSSAYTAMYTLPGASSPFQPTFTAQPKDFSVAINYNAGGTFASPYAIALDAVGNAWITNEGGTTVTELSPTGSVVVTATAPNLYGPQGVAVDRNGSVWVANTAGNSVVKYGLTAGAITSTNSFTANVLAPTSIALDSGGNAFVSNFNGNSVTKLSSAGAAGAPFTAGGAITLPSGLALDAAGNVLVTSGNGSVVKLGNDGTFVATETDSTLQGPLGVAVDPANRVFATGSTTGGAVIGAVSEFAANGTPAGSSPVQSGVGSPFGIAADSASAWVANTNASGGLVQVQFGGAAAVSPAGGFGSLNTPIGVAVDASGSVWTANSGSNTVSKFIGLAVPVSTPLSTTVGP